MFSRPLLVLPAGEDGRTALALAEALAPEAAAIHVRVALPPVAAPVWTEPDLVAVEKALAEAEAHLASLLRRGPPEVVGTIEVAPLRAVIDTALAALEPDVVVVAGLADADARALCRDTGVAVACGAVGAGPLRTLVHPFDGRAEGLASFAAFLRDRCDARHVATALAVGALDDRLSTGSAELAFAVGIRATTTVVALDKGLLGAALGVDDPLPALDGDLIVHSEEAFAGLSGEVLSRLSHAAARAGRAQLFLPPGGAVGEPTLDAFDVLAEVEPRVLRVEPIRSIVVDGPLSLLVAGEAVSVPCKGGLVPLPPHLEGAIAVGRPRANTDPLASVSTVFVVARLVTAKVALVDARLAAVGLAADDRTLVFVRLDPSHGPPRTLRAHLHAAGHGRALLVDLRELLDEGEARDVPAEVTAVRLCRAAARLRSVGVPVDAVVTDEPGHAKGHGFVVLGGEAAATALPAIAAPAPPKARSLRARLDCRTASTVLPGHRVHVELDNGAALRDVLATIAGARRRVHAQWYIVEDDPASREVEAALVQAAQRGLEVRVLVDSLYSLHGSLGAQNGLLGRLAAAGVELVASRPIDHLPGLSDLKQRDHRKVMVIDGQRARVSGRNLGQAYYRSFGEVALTPASDATVVPWLDASITVEGPAAAVLDTAFCAAWCEAGGAPFELAASTAAGATAVRVVEHHGLEDAYTLEAYLALVESAERELLVVNSFPLQLEVQRALLGAVARGVKLSVLVGRARPAHGVAGTPFSGRRVAGLADTLVRARLAALVEAGADVRELAIAPLPGWDPALEVVYPHVHAKLVLMDRRVLALGSANLDVTAGYWESEALVVIEDDPEVARVAAELERWFLPSRPIEKNDPRWLAGAAFRDFVGRMWPTVVG